MTVAELQATLSTFEPTLEVYLTADTNYEQLEGSIEIFDGPKAVGKIRSDGSVVKS